MIIKHTVIPRKTSRDKDLAAAEGEFVKGILQSKIFYQFTRFLKDWRNLNPIHSEIVENQNRLHTTPPYPLPYPPPATGFHLSRLFPAK